MGQASDLTRVLKFQALRERSSEDVPRTAGNAGPTAAQEAELAPRSWLEPHSCSSTPRNVGPGSSLTFVFSPGDCADGELRLPSSLGWHF